MKRFAVLFGIIAISTAVVTTSSFAEAPSVKDLPELRLLFDDGGAVSGTLSEQLMDAYNVFDFVKDVNDVPGDLTVSISSQSDVLGSPNPTIEVNDGVVDVFAGASTGWTQYAVDVDDASTAGKGVVSANADQIWNNNVDVAIAKFSTFNVDGPTLATGRGFAPVVDVNTQFFTRVWVGDSLASPDVPVNPSSQSVSWAMYVNTVTINDASLNYDLNGNYMGKFTELVAQSDQGEAITVGGFGWLVDAQGAIQISGSGTMSPGPWLVGLMATDTTDPNNKDATRLMVATGMLGVATAGNTPNHDAAETFDSLTVQTIPAAADYETKANGQWGAVPPYVVTVNDFVDAIGPGSHWCYNIMAGTDSFIDSVPLNIVNLPDTGAPAAVPGVAEGKCLRATITGAAQEPSLPGTGNGLRNQGFRISSRLFPNIEYGKVYTFSFSIATNAATAVNLPKYQMFLTSGDACLTSLHENTGAGTALLEALGDPMPQVPLPLSGQGWMTLSVNYTAPATGQAADLNGDGLLNSLDDVVRYNNDLRPRGATDPDPLKYARAAIRFWARTAQPAVTVWIDNMRVFESVYELDLANGAEVLNEHFWNADMDILAGFGLVEETTGAFDGTIESFVNDPAKDMHEDLLDIGIATVVSDTQARRVGTVGGGLATKMKYRAYDTSYTVSSGAGFDHTRNADSDSALKITLKGPSTETPTTQQIIYNAQLATDTIATDGDGLYALEGYFAAEGPFNYSMAAGRHPQIYVTLNEFLPSPLGNNSGAILAFGGLPDVGDEELAPCFNWQRIVVTMFSPASQCVRGTIQIQDAPGPVNNPVQCAAFQVPIYIDDLKIYKVADNLDQFDAELFE